MPILRPYLDSTHSQDFHFLDEAEYDAWWLGCEDIRNSLGTTNGYCHPFTSSDEVRHMYKQWLESCGRFIVQYGRNRVPKDIKLAINDVEERENLPKTDWKELKIHVNMSGPYGVPHYTFLFEDDGHEVS